MMRTVCAGIMIAGQLGVFICGVVSCLNHHPEEWRNMILALLFAIANLIIFFC